MRNIEVDEAFEFLISCLRDSQQRHACSGYGYDVYIPNIIGRFMRVVLNIREPDYLPNTNEARPISKLFYEAAWELCRRGILRPGVADIRGQITNDGSGGNGYSITSAGNRWLSDAPEMLFIPTEPGRYAKIIEKFRQRFGDAFMQRSQEAAKCYFATAYLACCAMSGAAAEAILLAMAVTKTGDDERVMKEYRRAGGRIAVENIIVGKLPLPLAETVREMNQLLKYWRDTSAHGLPSTISEFEAYEALARLLRFAHLADDRWAELTAP